MLPGTVFVSLMEEPINYIIMLKDTNLLQRTRGKLELQHVQQKKKTRTTAWTVEKQKQNCNYHSIYTGPECPPATAEHLSFLPRPPHHRVRRPCWQQTNLLGPALGGNRKGPNSRHRRRCRRCNHLPSLKAFPTPRISEKQFFHARWPCRFENHRSSSRLGGLLGKVDVIERQMAHLCLWDL